MTESLLSYFQDELAIQRRSVAGIMFAYLQASFLRLCFLKIISWEMKSCFLSARFSYNRGFSCCRISKMNKWSKDCL